MLVSLTVVVRVMVLRVVDAPSLPPAGTGWTRPVEECESPAPSPGAEAGAELSGSGVASGANCPSGVCPFSAGGAADPCSPATSELSVSGVAWFCATGASPFLSVGNAAACIDVPAAFASVSVLYNDALVWPYSIDVVAAWDPVSEPEGDTSCSSFETMTVDEDAGLSDCFSGSFLGGTSVDEACDCSGALSVG